MAGVIIDLPHQGFLTIDQSPNMLNWTIHLSRMYNSDKLDSLLRDLEDYFKFDYEHS